MDELKRLALESLVSDLRDQGLSARLVEDRVTMGRIGSADVICRCEVQPMPPGFDAAITPVGIEVAFAEDDSPGTVPASAPPKSSTIIRDIVVGLSPDRRESVVQATHTWCEGVFPPIRRALDPAPVSADEARDPRVLPFTMSTRDMSTGKVVDWEMILGLPQVGGPNAAPFAQFVGGGNLVPLLMDALTSAARDVRMHWVKVYVAFQPDGGGAAFECKLDNADWPEGVAALESVRWPRVPGFVHYRQFLVMRPSDAPDPQTRDRLEAFAREQETSSSLPRNDSRKPRRSWWPFGSGRRRDI